MQDNTEKSLQIFHWNLESKEDTLEDKNIKQFIGVTVRDNWVKFH